MLFSYLKTALRNFKRNLMFSFINVIGLAIGISASLVIYLIVHYDFSFDQFHPDKERIYRVVSIMQFPGQEVKNSGVPVPLSEAMQQQIAGIDATAQFWVTHGEFNVSVPSVNSVRKQFKAQEGVVFADNNYFKVFKYKWLAGSVNSSLTAPFNVVITASRAKAYFNVKHPADAIGHVIVYNDSVKTTVAGVIEDLTENTDFNFKDFISFSTIYNTGLKYNYGYNSWGSLNSNSQLFIKVSKNVAPNILAKRIYALHRKHVNKEAFKITYNLQPLADLHFNQEYDNFNQRQANRKTLYGLLILAGILLTLGCINFINLTTAQAVYRAKEIGVRKTMGGSQKQLIAQFLTETMVITAAATVLSLILVPFLLRIFTDFIPPELKFNILRQPDILVFTLVLIIVVGLISGFYPAMVLARFNPVNALKKQVAVGNVATRGSVLRKSLTIIQFVTAQAFIVATILISSQIHYVLNKNLGFTKDGIVVLYLPGFDKATKKVLMQKIQERPEVDRVVLAGSAPAINGYSQGAIDYHDDKKSIQTMAEIKYADSAYFNLYNIKLLAGKYLLPNDSLRGLMINETFARNLGFKHPADAIDKVLVLDNHHVPVVGVVADFYYRSLHNPIQSLAFSPQSGNFGALHIRLKPDPTGTTWKSALKGMEKDWKTVYPNDSFDYVFLNESIAKFYKSEQNISRLLKWATGLAIIISCLGLLGLVIHTTAQRTKEIGVRKVLGASVMRIVTLLSTDFIKLVLISIVIASPLAWLGVSKWMQGFAYRTTLQWGLFVIAGLITICIALFTIAFNSVKAAMANPVKSLRSE